MQIYEPPKPATSIPIIDIEAMFTGTLADRQAVAWEVHKACRETGFFYITNHRIPESLIAQQFAFSKKFFDLSLSEKMDVDMKKSATAAGYEPVRAQALDSQDPDAEVAPADLKESFYMGADLPDDHELARTKMRGYGHNQWPKNAPGFREQMLAYRHAMMELSDRLLALIALSLDLPEEWFSPYFDRATGQLRLIKYPPQPADALKNQIGAGAHTDWGTVTILAQDSSGGLEVRNVAGEWIDAKPVPGTFVINLGDLMARWTNGIYSSNMHRVKNNRTGHNRYSIPFFYNARPDALIEAIPGSVTSDRPQKFGSCTTLEHLSEMFRRSYGYEMQAAE